MSAQTPDLSPDGMFLNTPREFRPGAHVKLRFELLRTGVLIQVMGIV